MAGKGWFAAYSVALKIGLPVKGLIRNTIFNQFVGGETLEETSAVAENLAKYNVQVISGLWSGRKRRRRKF